MKINVAILTIAVVFCLSMFTAVHASAGSLTSACTVNDNCTVANSECADSVCACSTGFAVVGEECHVEAALGENCTGKAVCKVQNSECTSDACACQTGYEVDSASCVPGFQPPNPPLLPELMGTVELPCTKLTETAVCGQIENAFCDASASKCDCKAGYKKGAAEATCLQVLEMSCTEDAECTAELDNTVCSSDKCDCSADSVKEGVICTSSSDADAVKVQFLFTASLLMLARYLF